jgi:hypothetical protein
MVKWTVVPLLFAFAPAAAAATLAEPIAPAPAAAAAPEPVPPLPYRLEVVLAHPGAEREAATRSQLLRLLARYDASPWIFTHEVRIESRVIPHSHPVLTLSTRHLDDDELLLSTFVHEQLHWFLDQHEAQTTSAEQDLRAAYPKVPAGPPEGARDEESTYLHLLVNALEYQADERLLGPERARKVMERWSGDHYTWIYQTVLADRTRIVAILARHGLDHPDARARPAQ